VSSANESISDGFAEALRDIWTAAQEQIVTDDQTHTLQTQKSTNDQRLQGHSGRVHDPFRTAVGRESLRGFDGLAGGAGCGGECGWQLLLSP
jgi:hypothetical protein